MIANDFFFSCVRFNSSMTFLFGLAVKVRLYLVCLQPVKRQLVAKRIFALPGRGGCEVVKKVPVITLCSKNMKGILPCIKKKH